MKMEQAVNPVTAQPARSRARKFVSTPAGWMALIVIAVLATVFAYRPGHGVAPMDLADLPANQALSVMTYNVEGLPFPVRFGRSSALAAIGERLQALRATGRQPHIILLQEAFSNEAAALGAEAGYRFVAAGPSASVAGAQPTILADRDFAAASSALRGEVSGKWEGSGLRILSDYPIVGARQMAFPSYACAGFDCLANKGALLVEVRIPGMKLPIAVVDTHLNSRHASRATTGRSLYAWRRQVDALNQFIEKNRVPGAPL